MNQSREVPQRRAFAIRRRLEEATGQSGRTVLLGTVLLLSAFSAAISYVLAQCYSVDIVTSLLTIPEDCFGNWGTNVGRHCFGDYSMIVGAGLRPNPWDPYPMFPPHAPLRPGGPPAGMLPHLLFGLPAKLLGAPFLGLICYLLALAIAVLSPAIWAARGARGLERVVVFVVLGAVAIPVWAVIDRGNSAGFVVPIALVFLVALRRQRWGLVAIMVILAALVKPQYAALAIALFAARQWRTGCLAIGGVVISNLAAYLLWPRDFPGTTIQSINNMVAGSGLYLTDFRNVAFGRALLLGPDYANLFLTGKMPASFLAGPRALTGYVILALFVIAVVAMGRRIPPVLVGIVLLAAAALAPPLAMFYHLVFVLPIAALVVRNPNGPPASGIFDEFANQDGPYRRAVGICVSLAAAFSIAQFALPVPIMHVAVLGQTTTRAVVTTTAFLAPFLWLIACVVIVVSYARRPAPPLGDDLEHARSDANSLAEADSSESPVDGAVPAIQDKETR